MSSPTAEGQVGEGPWYRRWFGEAYLRLYPHRDEVEARRAVELLVAEGELESGDLVLDLACGAGRHLRSLRRHGLRSVGLDLSNPLLLSARAAGPRDVLVRGDMRALPFATGRFTAVASFFTSFGYFRTDADDRRVLAEIRRVLRSRGLLLLDFLNSRLVKETLSPRDEHELDGRRVVQERRLVDGGLAVEKTIHIAGTGEEAPQVFHERVRLYSQNELNDLLTSCRLIPERWFGDYGGGPAAEMAPRVIALARAS